MVTEMLGLMPRAAVVLASGWLVACGPSAGSGDGGGSASGGSGSNEEGASHEATGSSDTNAGPDCTQSDLPEPFCHELLVYEEDFGTPIGFLDGMRDGVRPLVVAGDEPWLRLVDPLNPDDVFAEVPPPLSVHWEEPGDLSISNGDFDGDGTMELVVLGTPAGSMDDQFAVLDGITLETLARRDEIEGYALKLGVLDLDGDGVDELITGDVGDLGVTISAWSVGRDDLSLVGTDFVGVPCEGWSFMHGDYNNDGHGDLTIAWQAYCEDYFDVAELGQPLLVTLLGGAAPGSGLELHYSPQPSSMLQAAVGNFDDDASSELLIARSVQEMIVVEWVSGMFAETGRFGIDDYESVSFGTLMPGRFTGEGSDGVLVGLLLRPAADGSFESFHGALFPGVEIPGLVMLPNKVARLGSSYQAADFNLDGVADFYTAVDGRLGVYLSIQ